MSINVSWVDDSKTAILREFGVSWTWDEFYESQNQVNEMLRSVEYKVHQVLDFSMSNSLPSNTLTHIRNSGRNMPENRGKSIVITHSAFYKQMYKILDLLFPTITERVVIVATREEALKEIASAKVQINAEFKRQN